MNNKTNRPSDVSRQRTGIITTAFLAVALVGGFLWYRQQDRYQEGAEKIASVPDGVSYTVRGGEVFFREDNAYSAGPMMASVATPVRSLREPEPVFVMQTFSLRDGSRREVVHESLKDVAVSDTLPVDGAVLYLTQAQAQGSVVPPASSSSVSAPQPTFFAGRRPFGPTEPTLPASPTRVPAPRNFSGQRSFLPNAVPRMDGHQQTSPRDIPQSTEPVILNRRPLNGGPTVKTTLDTGGYRINALPHVLTEEGLYWMRPVPKEHYYVERKINYHVPPPATSRSGPKAFPIGPPPGRVAQPPQITRNTILAEEIYEGDDLMLSPADGGPARKRASGLVADGISVTEDALYVRGLCATPGHLRGAVYRISRRDNSPPVNLHNFPSRDEDFSSPLQEDFFSRWPLELAGRLYWIERYKLEDDETASIVAEPTGRVVSSRLDGSDRRVIWEAHDASGKIMFPKQIFASKGKLYLVFMQAHLTPVPPPEDLRIELSYRVARLHTERSPALGTVQPLPPTAQLNIIPDVLPLPVHTEDGYFYFVTRTETKSPVDFLSVRTTAGYDTSLCRVKLPE